MAQTLFFYDLETTGFSPREDRIMQFAGQRTDLELNPIGEPYNVLVKLNDDTLPSPEALMVTHITPQQTTMDGYTEAEFAQLICDDICQQDTTMIGFNNIHFDDEFIRHLLWRNFREPYEWCWKDGRSRWDLLDVVRMTRALRPEGIEWPVVDGKAVNKLELITKQNGIDHFKAHDALSDVEALIAVTGLIKSHQPQLYDYLFKIRDKNEVKKLVNLDHKQPFVYVSGRYEQEYQKATVAFPLTTGLNGTVIVYDLRYDPTPFFDMTAAELKKRLYAPWDERQKDSFIAIPVKELHYNKVPAVAPVGVLEQQDGWHKISLDEATISRHMSLLLTRPDFAENIRSVMQDKTLYPPNSSPEAQLYDGFLNDVDRMRVAKVPSLGEQELADYHPQFNDERLSELLLHYKARNYPRSLSEDDVAKWEAWRRARLQRQLPGYIKSIQKIASEKQDDESQFILQELQLWAESIIPVDD
ncbi:MAG: exonuclease [Candidatus Saccharibacteria bacterium]|nr:exonuclease [Candidatus Saccharibacteria bacterium]